MEEISAQNTNQAQSAIGATAGSIVKVASLVALMAPSWRAVIVVAACVKVEALTLPRRRFCAAAAGAVVAPATGANAKDLY